MNRRIYIPEREDSKAWRLVSSILVFLFALAVCALLSVDDYEPAPQRPNPWEMTDE